MIDNNNDGETDIYPWVCNPNGAFNSFVYSNGTVFVYEDEDAFVNNTDSPEAVEALQFLRDYIQRGFMSSSWDQNLNKGMFTSGQAAFISAGIWEAANFRDSMEDEFGIVLYPLDLKLQHKVSVGLDGYVIPSAFDEETANKILYGIARFYEQPPSTLPIVGNLSIM